MVQDLFDSPLMRLASWRLPASGFAERAGTWVNVAHRAQSFGLACVVSDIAGNRAVVRDGVNGRVVPVGDAQALAAAVCALLDDPALRSVWGRRGRALMQADYGMEQVVGRLVALYSRLVAPVAA